MEATSRPTIAQDHIWRYLYHKASGQQFSVLDQDSIRLSQVDPLKSFASSGWNVRTKPLRNGTDGFNTVQTGFGSKAYWLSLPTNDLVLLSLGRKCPEPRPDGSGSVTLSFLQESTSVSMNFVDLIASNNL